MLALRGKKFVLVERQGSIVPSRFNTLEIERRERSVSNPEELKVNSFDDLRRRLAHQREPHGTGLNPRATAVVVDMLTRFPACQPDTIRGVKSLLGHAIENGWGIIFLEHLNWGETHPDILELLVLQDPSRLKLCALRPKQIWDGSEQVAHACTELELPTGEFYVGGVNTFECVQDTVIGLEKRFPSSSINVVKAACNCETGKCWSTFHQSDRVKLVDEVPPVAG